MKNRQLAQQIDAAIGAHGAWKLRLRTAIAGSPSDVTPQTACRDDACAFGHWLHGADIDAPTRAGMPYQVVRRLHAEFHRSAGEVLTLALAGNRIRATDVMEADFTPRSDKLVRALTKWKREAQQMDVAA